MTADTWLAKRLEYLRELKSPSATQKLLIDLAGRPALSAREQRELDALVRLEKINDRAAQAKVKAHKILREKAEGDRKARNHRLIMQGALFDLANLQDIDKGVLLGGLLALSKELSGPDAQKIEARFKASGDALLAARNSSTKPSSSP